MSCWVFLLVFSMKRKEFNLIFLTHKTVGYVNVRSQGCATKLQGGLTISRFSLTDHFVISLLTRHEESKQQNETMSSVEMRICLLFMLRET